ncbi:hypothetical protein [Ammoniphilus resinae]|uniref:Uncharacterized protein n=1 Tax=Ammoniphilus resinae TaxID=861532 RepID=A0ABS4GMR2_9BACL|nr:hypothetical protein [Ammoniphilus resinae]MBP1931150.1 hypothetical protein [Ammoniphilus resinae]
MIESTYHPRDRFVLIPYKESQFVVYDSLLEQPIGQPHASIHLGLDMATHLNRNSPMER